MRTGNLSYHKGRYIDEVRPALIRGMDWSLLSTVL